jgi:dTDP-4-dehydrorhamnose 3,5-epimerase
MLEGMIITPLKRIETPKGDVFHALKNSDNGYDGFGEAYFSTVNQGEIKGWKKHIVMVLNLIVPLGAIRFVAYDERESSQTCGDFYEIEISSTNYSRLTFPPGIWLAFQGRSANNMLLNIASIEHEPSEAINMNIEDLKYSWEG